MELTEGYKKTFVGLIPVDWDVKSVSYFGSTKRGAGSQYIKYVKVNGIRLIRINDFFEDNPVFVVPTEEIKNYILTEEDILFAGTGASAGSSFIPKKDWIGLPHSYNAPRIRTNRNNSKEYLLYSLQSGYVLQQQRSSFVGAAQPFLDIAAISNFFIATPPTKAEQTAIATALSDIDALITSLEKLIAKKRNIKQGAMQKLLKPKKGWMKKRLNQVAEIDSESLSGSTDPEYSFKYISLEDVDEGVLKKMAEIKFKDAPSRARRKIKVGDILVSTVRPNLKSHLLISKKVNDWVCSTGFSVIRCHKNVADSSFIFNLFFTSIINHQIERIISGSNYPSINSAQVKSLEFFLPTIEEQINIAAVWADMDLEIQMLEAKLAKCRSLKYGMMQSLLTGKIRLV